MQLAALLCVLELACAVATGAQDSKLQAGSRPDRIVNDKHGFSVMFPPGWFVFDNGDMPTFYNFPPEQSIQGNLPVGGASIELLIRAGKKEPKNSNPLGVWADHEVAIEHGIDVEHQALDSPVAAGGLRPLRVSFDRKPLGTHTPSQHFVIILWPAKSELFGAKLSYLKDDPKASHYERTLARVVGSFRRIGDARLR
jgi:hypothetical protein